MCGCEKTAEGCYSHTGLHDGEYCGIGCIGESCLYYQIGCFQSCGTCSYTGKTLYPVPSDLTKAGCQTPPAPTLGGGDLIAEHSLRTYNIDGASQLGDWTAWMPWRSPGSAGKGNPSFQPCGVNSGASSLFPLPPAAGQPAFANGTDLPPLKTESQVVWKAGSVVEASWGIYANHGGGYSYRICKKDGHAESTEECYQRGHLAFATDTTQIRFAEDSGRSLVTINATTTSVGTFPKGSMWRKNPIPMCNCDIGQGCRTKTHSEFDIEPAPAKICKSVILSECGTTTGVNTCLKCGGNSSYDCEECCPNTTKTVFDGFSFCKALTPDPSPAKTCTKEDPRGCYTNPYPKTYFAPGETSETCPTGFMFPAAFSEGVGAGLGSFSFELVDMLVVPDVPAGEYSVSWRWDCEQTPQVWNSCADITITH